ncbi:MAG: pantoate--beta-alanine ligase [Gammaproteobacteria bacterium]|nr:pantoate--beta-alanine ligase [Gammaproteobacteria bacterium]MCP5200738.1 pantoate--beta-alanine ligase [Gammaproteobacteria bacterium]
MDTAFDLKTLRATVRDWKTAGLTVALVPTMGNLHAGHISLLKRARELADRTVVSIFVNPIQFGKGEDYDSYPSTLEADKAKLSAAGLDLLFAPNLDELYPGGTAEDTRITVPQLSDILCGEFRPGHFSGVATVVAKLLINVQPDTALFGEKDYQQLLVIRRMVHDLLIPVDIIGMPIVREPDGLAMSSRNGYLDATQRATAAVINQALTTAAARLREPGARIATIEGDGIAALAAAGMRPEYFSVRRSNDLAPPRPGDTALVVLAAAWLGPARLIDNVQVELAEPLAA